MGRGWGASLYGDGQQERDWIHVEDHCRALAALLLHPGRFSPAPGAATDPAKLPIFDISARSVVSNRTIVELILQALGKRPEDWIEFVADRPNHDRRYVIEPGRIEQAMDWTPRISLAEGIRQTVQWYVENPGWWKPIVNSSRRLQFDWETITVQGT